MKKIVAFFMMIVLMAGYAMADFSMTEIGQTEKFSYKHNDGTTRWEFQAWIDGTSTTTEKEAGHKLFNKCNTFGAKSYVWDFSITAFCLTSVGCSKIEAWTAALTTDCIDELYTYIGVEGCWQENNKTCKEDGKVISFIKEAEGNTVKMTLKAHYKNKDNMPDMVILRLAYVDAEGNETVERIEIPNTQKGFTINYKTCLIKRS